MGSNRSGKKRVARMKRSKRELERLAKKLGDAGQAQPQGATTASAGSSPAPQGTGGQG
jgi:hypothetical protein